MRIADASTVDQPVDQPVDQHRAQDAFTQIHRILFDSASI